ncbi:MAG: hypothetical protein GY846_15760 [Deltaproteobacteria bacterium]|nr:hypothetical protein [Deltaproteobacteria bacterium]
MRRAPMKFGAPFSGNLANSRKLCVGEHCVVYQEYKKTVVLYVLAAGLCWDKEIYR